MKLQKFWKKHNLKLVESEKVLYSERGFCGTLDLIAKDHTNTLVASSKAVYTVWWRASTLWLSDKLEYNYPKYYRNCITNRGYSVLN